MELDQRMRGQRARAAAVADAAANAWAASLRPPALRIASAA